MGIEAVLALIGGIALLIGIFGGGIEAEKIKIPQIGWILRIVLTLIGAGLMMLAVSMARPDLLQQEQPVVTLPPTLEPAGDTDPDPSTPAVASPSPIPAIGRDIAITEIMAVPCGGLNSASVNEYIEIYNYGAFPADVNGWWLASNNRGEGSAPDRIVGWEARNPGISLGGHVRTNDTIIPPSGYGVILTPGYFMGDADNRMPYLFPEGVTLLTVERGEFLGNDSLGLVGNADPLSVVVLYTGSEAIIENVISTYGTPKYGASPDSIRDDGLDGLPLAVSDACSSVERISVAGPDSENNWKKVRNGTPGYGP